MHYSVYFCEDYDRFVELTVVDSNKVFFTFNVKIMQINVQALLLHFVFSTLFLFCFIVEYYMVYIVIFT